MDLGSPITTVIPHASGEVLAVLANTSEELTGNVIAGLTDGRVSQTGVNKALKRLVESGLVHARPAGSSILYSFNRDHVAAGAVLELANLRSTLLTRLKDLVGTWLRQPVTVAMFGSAARGEGGPTSDIDLLIIRSDDVDAEDAEWSRQLEELAEAVGRWSGNPCELLEYSEQELAALVSADESLIANLRSDAVAVAGTAPRSLLVKTR